MTASTRIPLDQTMIDAGSLSDPATLRDYVALCKPRMTVMVVLTAAVGFWVGHGGAWTTPHVVSLCMTCLGTALTAIAAGIINQVAERNRDARMMRTAWRPVAAGRISPQVALSLAVVAGVAGAILLFVRAGVLPTAIALAALLVYVAIYTPLKPITPLSVWIGAIPGALPILIGWSAATGDLRSTGWMLFCILFVWQLPHFQAIAWMYRDDYANAGYAVLPVVDPTGRRAVRHCLLLLVLLIPVSLLPAYRGVFGPTYFFGAVLASFAFLAFGVELARSRTRQSAQRLMMASLAYLSLLLLLMVIDVTAK